MTNDLPKIILPKDAIYLETAQDWVKNWKEKGANYMQSHQLNAFLIPGIDVKDILIEGASDVRGYLGLKKLEDGTFEPHMLVVGVDDKGIDMINYNPKAEKNYFIYDFSLPCPSTCDTSSPLFIK